MKLLFLITPILVSAGCVNKNNREAGKPNILICIADDASYPHMGEEYKWLHTPAFDRIANEGLAFTYVYTPSSKCAPSRYCLLTGRYPWQLKQAANHFYYFPSEFIAYAEVLGENGYYVGYTARGWGPGIALTEEGESRELTERSWNKVWTTPPTSTIANIDYAANYAEFYKHKPDDRPFVSGMEVSSPTGDYEYASSISCGPESQ